MAGKPHLTEAEWHRIEGVLPKSRGGRPRTNDRAVITGILDSLASGAPFAELERYADPSTLETRFRRWERDGTLERICAAIDFRPLEATSAGSAGRRDLSAPGDEGPGWSRWLPGAKPGSSAARRTPLSAPRAGS